MGPLESELLVLTLSTLWGLGLTIWKVKMSGLTKKNACLAFSQSLTFTILHPWYQAVAFLQALHQEKASLSTHYGAITGLAELGQEVGTNKYKMVCFFERPVPCRYQRKFERMQKFSYQVNLNSAKLYWMFPSGYVKKLVLAISFIFFQHLRFVGVFSRLLISHCCNVMWISHYTNLSKINYIRETLLRPLRKCVSVFSLSEKAYYGIWHPFSVKMV